MSTIRKIGLVYVVAATAWFAAWPVPTVKADDFFINRVTVVEVPPVFGTKPTGIIVKITWSTTSPSYGQVDYGTTTAYGSVALQAPEGLLQHEVQIQGLKGETTYHFKIEAITTAGQHLESFDQTFKTSKFVDITPPVISNVSVTFTGGTYFIVTWFTDKSSDSGVDYSTRADFSGSRGAGGNRDTTSHEVVVGSLSPNTTYYFRVHSNDSNSNRTTVVGSPITTTVTDVNDRKAPLVISQVSPVSYPDPLISSTAITFTWHTNQPSRGHVSVSGPGGKGVDEKGFLALDHMIGVAGLKPDTVYVATISAGDIFGHSANIGNITLRTSTTATVASAPATQFQYPQPQVEGASTCYPVFAYGTCRDVAAEQRGAVQLRAALERYFHGRVPRAAQRRWYTWVNAYVYGGYPVVAVARAVQGQPTVHAAIPWSAWKNSPDYKRGIDP